MKKYILTIIILGLSVCLFAQSASRDISFLANAGTDGKIWAVALQTDGKILVGGFFQHCNGAKQRHIARLNPDGSLDTTFHTGEVPASTVQTISVQSDGKIIIGGTFMNHKSTNKANHLARLNPDGSLDTTFQIGTGFENGSIWATLIQPDGKILVGGLFNKFNGQGASSLVRLLPTGVRDNTFNQYVNVGGASTFAIALEANGNILVGTSASITRLSPTGQKDTAFYNHANPTQGIRDICVQADGKIVVVGPFNYISGQFYWRNIARLSSTGYNEMSFHQSPAPNYYLAFHAAALQNDGKIVCGGRFNLFDNAPQNYLIRLNTDGTKDVNFDIGTGLNGFVHKVLIQPDGKIVVVGEFTEYQGKKALHIVRLMP